MRTFRSRAATLAAVAILGGGALTACGDDGADVRQLEEEGGTETGGTGTGGGETGTGGGETGTGSGETGTGGGETGTGSDG